MTIKEHFCHACDYKTFDKSNFTRHLTLPKHVMRENGIVAPKTPLTHDCFACGYKTIFSANMDRHVVTKKHRATLVRLAEKVKEVVNREEEDE